MTLPDHAREVRLALNDPRVLCAKLGLLEKTSLRQAAGVTVRCPVHGGLSCSVTLARDHTIRVRCFGCDFTGDSLTLIATVRGLPLQTAFREVLREGAELAGLHHIVAELRGERVERRPPPPVTPPPAPEPEYPADDTVAAVWGGARRVTDDADACAMLRTRGIDPELVAVLDLARSLAWGQALPVWATFRGLPWTRTGHRLVLPCYDDAGAMRSVRAWRVVDADSPKRLPPGGCKAAGLVLANAPAVAMLRGIVKAPMAAVVEGEPDALVWMTRDPLAPIFGVFSGAWTAGFAAAIPDGTRVILRTHDDDQGERYAKKIAVTLRARCRVARVRGEGRGVNG